MHSSIQAYDFQPSNSKEARHFASIELVILVIIELSGFVLNGAVLIILCIRYKFLQDKSRYLLLGNILLCDFILLCFIIPTSMKFASCQIESCRATVLESFCSSLTLLLEFSYICAICTQACLAIDTVIKVHNSGSKHLRKRNYWLVVVLSWLLSILPTIISRLPNMNRENFTFYVDLQKCKDYDASECFYQVYIFLVLHALVVPIIPGCYFYLAFAARRLRTRLHKQFFLLKQNQPTIEFSNAKSNGENDLSQTALPQESLNKNSESALRDIRYLFARSISKPPDIGNSETLSFSSKSLTPKKSLLYTSPVRIEGNNETSSNIPYINIDSPQTPSDNKSRHSFQANFSEIAKPLLNISSLSHNESFPLALAHKSTQTSLDYMSSSNSSEEWISSSIVPDANFINTSQTLLSPTDQPFLSHYLPNKPKRLCKSDTLDKTNESSKETSFAITTSRETKTHLQAVSPQWRLVRSKPSETALIKRSPITALDKAATTLCHRGLLLITVVYICSVPYVLVNKCSRLKFSSQVDTVAVCLYYSTCIWYPIIYFFMSANFRRQFMVTTNWRHS